METSDLISLILKVFISALGTVGLIEFLKNFIKTSKTWIYSIMMPVIATLCFFLCEKCNIGFIGSVLTIGAVQLNYQILIQGFKKVINGTISKVSGNAESEEKTENTDSGTEKTDFSEQ